MRGPSLDASLSVLVPLAPLGQSRSVWQAQPAVNNDRNMAQPAPPKLLAAVPNSPSLQ